MNNLGARVFGLGAMMMGVAGLLWADFATGWLPVPATLPGRALFAYVAGALLFAGGALINIRRVWGAMLLTAVFAAGFVLLDLVPWVTHAGDFGYWESGAESLALALAAFIVFAPGRITIWIFALCLLVFGAAHFVYPAYTATFIPKWMPLSPMFWVYLTGVAAIAAGLGILSGIQAVLAARLLTAMYVLFGIVVHTPLVWANPANHNDWIEFIVNLALAGAAWIVADALAARQAPIRVFHASRGMS